VPGLSRPGVVQALWVEGPLSPLEQLSIRSFLAQGHPVHVYSYGEVSGLPDGARLLPAEEILPADEVFRYDDDTGQGSYAGFANLFRYKLLFDRGGWWSDLDVVALAPFDLEEDWVFASERLREGGTLVTNSVLKAPPGSAFYGECFQRALRDEERASRWGAIGPRFLHAAVERHGLLGHVVPPEVFCPVDWWRAGEVLQPMELPAESRAVHLWNEMWRAHGWSREPVQPPGVLYGKLHRLYPRNSMAYSQESSSFIRAEPVEGLGIFPEK